MIKISFNTDIKEYQSCLPKFRFYTSYKLTVKFLDIEVIAMHKLNICNNDSIVYRSNKLGDIIRSKCAYANDVLLKVTNDRFIDGIPCSEISTDTVMSERHAGRTGDNIIEAFKMKLPLTVHTQ